MNKLKELGGALRDGTLIHYGFATVLSFGHIHDLAAAHGQTGWKAWCYPPSVDLLIYSGWRRIRSGHGVGIGWFAFLFGIFVSLAANVAESYYTTHSIVGVVIGVYPSLGMLVATLLSHSDDGAGVVQAAVAPEPEVQEEHGGKQRTLHAVPDDTPEQPQPNPRDTPVPDFPEQGDPGFYEAVVALVSAAQPVNTFPNVSKFCDACIAWLVSHGYRSVHPMTIRRALPHQGKKAA